MVFGCSLPTCTCPCPHVLNRFSRVQLYATPWTVTCQAPLSMGFSRQESWSGLPCPPPGDLPNPRVEPRSPSLQVDSLPSEPPEKPENTGVGSLFLLQGIFLTQESNWGFLHCRQILYQLSSPNSPHSPGHAHAFWGWGAGRWGRNLLESEDRTTLHIRINVI